MRTVAEYVDTDAHQMATQPSSLEVSAEPNITVSTNAENDVDQALLQVGTYESSPQPSGDCLLPLATETKTARDQSVAEIQPAAKEQDVGIA
jgi:hypothetical protein